MFAPNRLINDQEAITFYLKKYYEGKNIVFISWDMVEADTTVEVVSQLVQVQLVVVQLVVVQLVVVQLVVVQIAEVQIEMVVN